MESPRSPLSPRSSISRRASFNNSGAEFGRRPGTDSGESKGDFLYPSPGHGYESSSSSPQASGSLLRHPIHPLQQDTQHLHVELLNEMRKVDENATLEDLALEKTPAAKEALRKYGNRHGNTKENIRRGHADTLMLKSMVATALLHQSGAIARKTGFTQGDSASTEDEDREEALIAAAGQARNAKGQLIEAYGLDKHEVRAIEAYSDANKDKRKLGEKPNRHYMGHDEERPDRWGKHGNGWQALASAMKKVPSLGDLGVELTTYRAPRARPEEPLVQVHDSEMEEIARLAPGTNVVHGATVMSQGQGHYLSTAISYNSHWDRAEQVGGLVAMTGRSGVFINPLGVQGAIDGGEILYPPGTTTAYEGINPTGYRRGRGAMPVAHFREVRQRESGQALADDLHYTVSQPRHPRLDAYKQDQIQSLEGDKTPESVTEAISQTARDRKDSGLVDRGLMYLTVDELADVTKHSKDRSGPKAAI